MYFVVWLCWYSSHVSTSQCDVYVNHLIERACLALYFQHLIYIYKMYIYFQRESYFCTSGTSTFVSNLRWMFAVFKVHREVGASAGQMPVFCQPGSSLKVKMAWFRKKHAHKRIDKLETTSLFTAQNFRGKPSQPLPFHAWNYFKWCTNQPSSELCTCVFIIPFCGSSGSSHRNGPKVTHFCPYVSVIFSFIQMSKSVFHLCQYWQLMPWICFHILFSVCFYFTWVVVLCFNLGRFGYPG